MLLGNAGAITRVHQKDAVGQPSVDRPNRLTARCPRRNPSPHFTTARATRKAMTMRRIVEFANPPYACSRREQARHHGAGNGERRRGQDRKRAEDHGHDGGEKDARTAARLRRVSPSGGGTNQITRASSSAAIRANISVTRPAWTRSLAAAYRAHDAAHVDRTAAERIAFVGDHVLPAELVLAGEPGVASGAARDRAETSAGPPTPALRP